MEPAKKSRFIACDTSFFDMRSYKIESYVPEASFLSGKDARFCRAAFENCFVIDVHSLNCIASSKEERGIDLSMATAAKLLSLFDGSHELLALPSPQGTLLFYPAWPHLGLGLAFLLKEDVEIVQKAYQNAKRYAFSMIFDAEKETEGTPQAALEVKLCMLRSYMDHLFGEKRQTNIMAQVLMIANLMGCKLHKVSAARVDAIFDDIESERLSAYLCCVFMTMRRYNGTVSATEETDENASFFTHVSQEYGLRIQQSIKQRVIRPSLFDLPTRADIASFASHPAFADYKIEETEGTLRMYLPLRQKALLSSVTVHGREQELVITLFSVL